MKPLNIEDRRKAFIQYLIMYVVTTALLIYAICFVCGVPGKQNAILAEKNRQLMATVSAPDKFINERNELNTLLLTVDSLNYNSLQDAMIRIQRTKGDLRNNFERDSAILGNPLAMSYLNAVDVSYKLLLWKSDKMKSDKNSAKLEEKCRLLEQYNDKLVNQLNDAKLIPSTKPIGIE